MADDKKKVVTDEDISQLLEELLGDVEEAPAAPAPQVEDAKSDGEAPRGDEADKPTVKTIFSREDPNALPESAQNDFADASRQQEHETSEDEEDFFVDEASLNPKLEAAMRRTERARARAEAMASGAAVAYEKTRKAVEPVAKVLGRDEATRKRTLQSIWQYIGFIAALCTGLVFLVYVYIGISLTGEQEYKEQLSTAIKNMTGHELQIEGSVRFELFPRPRFTVGVTQLKNLDNANKPFMLTVRSIELSPSFFWLALNTIKVNKVVLQDPVLNLENYIGEVPNWQWYSKGSTWYDGSGKTIEDTIGAEQFLVDIEEYLGGANIILSNAKISYSSGDKDVPTERIVQLNNAKLRADSLHGPFASTGVIIPPGSQNAVNYTLKMEDLQEKLDPKVFLNLTLGSSAITMDGTVQGSKDHRFIKGKLKSSVVESSGGVLGSKLFSGVLSEGNSLLEGDFFASKERIGLQNVVLNAAAAKGKMDVELEFGAPNTVSLALDAEVIDLDKIFGKTVEDTATRKVAQLHSTLSETLLGISLPRDIVVRLDTTIKAFTYKAQTINNFRVDAQAGSNSLILRAVNLESLPGNTTIKAAAKEIENNEFAGKISVRSDNLREFFTWYGSEPSIAEDQLKNFSLEGQTLMSEKHLTIKDIAMQLGETHVTGDITLKGNKGILAEMDLALDIIDIHALESKKSETEALVASQDFFAPLRKVNAWFESLNLKLAIAKLRREKHTVENFYTKASFMGGNSLFEQMTFDSEFGKVAFSGDVNHQLLKPRIGIVLDIEKASFDDLGALFGLDGELKEKARWTDQLVRIDRLGGYNGHIALKVGTLTHKNFIMEDISTGLAIDNEQVTLEKFRAKVFNSRLQVDGYIIANDQPMANFTFSSSNVDVHDMLNMFFGFAAIDGKASMSGSISVSGLSPYQWISTMQGTVSYISRGLRVRGFDIALLLQRLPGLQSLKEVKYWIPKALYAGESDFQFASGSGKFVQGVLTMPMTLRHPYMKNIVLTNTLNLVDWVVKLDSTMALSSEKLGSYSTSLTMHSNIDQPVPRWDQKSIEATWEEMFYSGAYRSMH